MNIIDTTEALNEFCTILKQQTFITIDSEFIRERTYYPVLCLLQVGYDGGAAIIDPMSDIDLAPFFEILQSQNIVKVFHAGRQDIEIFYHLTGKIPCNIFDTQIAAMVCGFPEYIGYGNLVQAICKIDLDKSSRLTDWSQRPLDTEQLQYALGDVTHLVMCYQYLHQTLEEKGRIDWINEEISTLYDESTYKINPDEAWHRIKHNIHSQHFLSALKYLAAWRESRAQKFNTPRSSISKDDVLLNIASSRPKNVEELKRVRCIKPDVANGKLGLEILQVLQTAKENPLSAEECRKDGKNNVQFSRCEQSLTEMLRLLLKIKSQEVGVVGRIIASEDDLRFISAQHPEKSMAMHGWRYEVFGRFAEQLCLGKLSISYNPQKKCIDVK